MTGWGIFHFFFLLFRETKLRRFAVFVLKSNPKPKVLTPHPQTLSSHSRLTHLKLASLTSISKAFISLCLCLSQAQDLSGLCLTQVKHALSLHYLRSLHSGFGTLKRRYFLFFFPFLSASSGNKLIINIYKYK